MIKNVFNQETAAFGKGMQLLISGSPYDETEQHSQLISTRYRVMLSCESST